MSERLNKLTAMLERDPSDTFLIYAIAQEHKKAGNFPEALVWLQRVVEKDPAYCVAYHQAGLVHEETGDLDAARHAYRQGIDAAGRAGDLHAKGEMEAALQMIE